MVRQHQIAAIIAVTLALTASVASTAGADPAPLARGEVAIAATNGAATGSMSPQPTSVRVTSSGIPSSAKPCSPTCGETLGQPSAAGLGFKRGPVSPPPAAQLGFNRGPIGQASAAQLGFDRGPIGQASAAQLGFNREPVGQAPAAELGFNPRPIGQHPAVAPSGSYAQHATPAAVASEGFDWGDAGIGAGGALGLMMLLVGGALLVSNARQRPRRNATQRTA